MKPILTINAGSSSLKCSLFQGEIKIKEFNIKNLQALTRLFPSLPPLEAIGHRIVHGGRKYTKSTLITPKLLKEIKKLTALAPLHNGPAVEVIDQTLRYFGNKLLQVAVFDTAFYTHMPDVSRYYAIPMKLADRFGIIRYGFHGISHQFLWNTFVKNTGKKRAKVISLHLGAGCSITAIDSGRAINCSMGFTPNEGLVMATRSGDINPDACLELQKALPQDMQHFLTYKCGLLGLSGISSDMRELIKLYPETRLAIDLFTARAVHYIGAFIAALEGVDAIIFSAGIGENAPEIRKMIVEKLAWYGIKLDPAKNNRATNLEAGDIRPIHKPHSKAALYVIATNENLQIAKETKKVCLDSE